MNHFIFFSQKADVDKQLGLLKMSQEEAQRRRIELERKLDELVQAPAINEQEGQKIVEAQQDLDDMKQQLDTTKTENLVNSFLLIQSLRYYSFISFR